MITLPKPTTSKKRLFIAVDPSKRVRAAALKAVQPLHNLPVNIRWLPPDALHLTLVFLGDTDTGRIPELENAMETAADTDAFEAVCRGLGVFGSRRHPRIVWAGIEDPDARLAQIRARLTTLLEPLGWAPEARSFHPHLTLGRVRSPDPTGALTSTIAEAKNTDFGPVPVDKVTLYESILEPQGARYISLKQVPLKRRAPHARKNEEG